MCAKNIKKCPRCGQVVKTYRNPVPTVDIIIEKNNKICLIERKNPPHGWAIPGGFVDYGEDVESAAVREAFEETGLSVRLIHLLGVYSNPDRDSRLHTVSTVFIAAVSDDKDPIAGDDAASAEWISKNNLPHSMAFDHKKIIDDYFKFKKSGVEE